MKKNLKKVGLLQPIVWNEPTKHIVSGHQKMSILDELEGSNDYFLDVSVVQLSEKVEKEQNIFFNSTTFTGEFDLTALKSIIDEGLDYEAAGLDKYDLNIIGVEAIYKKEDEKSEALQNNAPDEQETEKTPEDDADTRKAIIKAEKARAAAAINGRVDEGEAYVTLSFDSYKEKKDWMRAWGFGQDDLFIKGAIFQQIVQQRIEDNGK